MERNGYGGMKARGHYRRSASIGPGRAVVVGALVIVAAVGGCGGINEGSGETAAPPAADPQAVEPERSPAERFQGYAGVGEPLERVRRVAFGSPVTLRFRDKDEANTTYKICLENEARRACEQRGTGRPDRFDDYVTPTEYGRNIARWYVDGEQVARWSFEVEPEQDNPGTGLQTAPEPHGDETTSEGDNASCGTISAGGGFKSEVQIQGFTAGEPDCAEAKQVMRSFLTGGASGHEPGATTGTVSEWECVTPNMGDTTCTRPGQPGTIIGVFER